MNQKLQQLLDSIQQSPHLSDDEKAALTKTAKEVDKEIEITTFKLDRTEKVKKTTAILLEETIEELEQKRKAVEAQNKELEIEKALEKVRSSALSMKAPSDMLEVCRIISEQLELLHVKEIRNVQTAIFYEERGTYMNYEYYAKHKKTFITEVDYTNHEVAKAFAGKMLKGKGETFVTNIEEEEKVKEWLTYQKTTNVFIDTFLETAASLNYYWFSLGPVALGISTYVALEDKELRLFKRFLSVFELAYRRYLDIEKAEAQAKEAKIEAALERVRSRTMGMQKSEELKEVIQVVYEQFVYLNINTEHAGFVMDYKVRDDHFIWVASKYGVPAQLTIPHFDCEYYNRFKEAKEKGWDFFAANLSFEEKNNFYRQLFTYIPGLPEDAKDFYFNCPGLAISTVLLDNIGLYIENFEGIPYSDEDNAILMRFGKVFQQTYTRFLDLQKAEAQAREAQIEAALERVRAKAMAMHKSDDLHEAVAIVFQELDKLNLGVLRVGISVLDKERRTGDVWLTSVDTDKAVQVYGNESFDFHPLMQGSMDAWIRQEDFYYILEGEDLTDYYKGVKTAQFDLPASQVLISGNEYKKQFFYVAVYNAGGLFAFREDEFTPEAKGVMKRFANVFDLTYKRFLDLQRAEAQAKEAQVQLAMERVRARTMAMQQSSELPDAANILFQQVQSLGMPAWSAGYCTWDEDRKDITLWMSSAGIIQKPFRAPVDEDPSFKRFYEAMQRGEAFYVEEIGGKELVSHYGYMCKLPVVGEMLNKFVEDGGSLPVFQIFHLVFFSQGFLLFITYEPVPGSHEIFKRFGKVFEQTYTRFLDLQKAEAQAREARIEASLERVRARTMAMQNSSELGDLVAILFEELTALELILARCIIWIFEENTLSARIWMANSEDKKTADSYYIKKLDHPYYDAIIKGWKERNPKWVYDLEGGTKRSIDLLLLNETELSQLPDAVKKGILESNHTVVSGSFNNFGLIEASGPFAHTEEQLDILSRFGKVFDLGYTRFNDLKQAEAQAREAQIEASLERVRAAAMSMMTSTELLDVCESIYNQLQHLGFSNLRCAQIYILDDVKQSFLNYEFAEAFKGRIIEVPYDSHPNVTSFVRDIKITGAKLIEIAILGDKIGEWKEFLYGDLHQSKELLLEQATELYYNHYAIDNGALSISTFSKITDEQKLILERLRNVFGLSFKRYTDLAQAEAQAREAKIETALERVRSRTLAMQKSDELAETAAVLFQQLIALGIEPNRLYISIIKSETGDTEFWITDEDGTKVSTAFAANMNDNSTFFKMYEGWKQQLKSLVLDMQGEELQTYFRYLTSLGVPFKGGLEQKRRVQDIAYFSKGFIGIASPDEQPKETMELLERFASVFNLTFTRFNDLKIAEAHALQAEQDLIEIKAARKKAEDTLAELQVTQRQLIQSEKMASLGELTAGIAHEIQNPLNFVNNFSEVSNELIAEMVEEVEKGNYEEAKAIAEDVKQNLEKINHHGKRADAIVKGMLQHSRTSSGVKEPTDINTLTDEYLRLAYHGLRARDKTFNSVLKTDFDTSIGKINIISQDIGRVILNLITNAFYAVGEKNKQQVSAGNTGFRYEPVVSVHTKKVNSTVEIHIVDNGNGIPKNIIDKIFQPFFTTKPTGQGTGLGLSLAYDIVKGHGGELKVETKEGEGSEFILQLPV